MATLKVDIYSKCLTKTYTQACKRCSHWVTFLFQLENIMERVVSKYFERKKSLAIGKAACDNTLVDNDIHKGNTRTSLRVIVRKMSGVG